MTRRVLGRWQTMSHQERMLKVVQPLLVGLIDGSLSTLAPVFAMAYATGAHAAFIVGVAASVGAAISMGLSEGLSDDGELTGRGSALWRGLIVAAGTAVGGMLHTLPFIAPSLTTALAIAYPMVALELIAIALVRKRFQQVSLTRSMVQVTFGGAVVVVIGIMLGAHG